MSMKAIYDLAPQPGTNRIMLVMLPSAKALPQDLMQYGFVRELRERSLPIDVVAVEAHLGYYLERSFSQLIASLIRLHIQQAGNDSQIVLNSVVHLFKKNSFSSERRAQL